MASYIRKLLPPFPVGANSTVRQLNEQIYELHMFFRLISPLGLWLSQYGFH